METLLNTPKPTPEEAVARPDLDLVTRAVNKRSFATLGTTSISQRPHVAGVLYAAVDDDVYVSTSRPSRKARNILANPRVFVCVPVRRLPVGPPSSIQFASSAEVLDNDHPDIVRLAAEGRLKAITSHGELTLPDGCFVRIAAPTTYFTYGLGLPLRRLLRDPLRAGSKVSRP